MLPLNSFERCGSPEPTLLSDSKKQKNSIKFNRKQDSGKGDRKKTEPLGEMVERICFISPPKTNINPTYPQLIPSTINQKAFKTRQNTAVSKEQSYILTNESPMTHDHKMNDSMLSLMQQLKCENQRKYQSEMHEYLMMISSLRDDIDKLQKDNRLLSSKARDVDMLQEFLIERQTYISEVTDRNIQLNEQLHQTQKEKEKLSHELNQLQADYNNEHQMYESYVATLKNERDMQKGEFDMILKLNIELNEQLQEANCKRGERFKRLFRQNSEEKRDSSPKKHRRDKHLKDHKHLQIQLIDGCETFRSKETDLSELNVKSMDESRILQRLNDQFEPCDCKDTTKKLRQKIRYNQIQIDILKRIKVSSEKIKEDNEKLKVQNRKLRQKIDNLLNKAQKKQKHNSNSDSSLELSLSPKKV